MDDDESVRDALSSLLRSAGYKCVVYSSAKAFLASGNLGQTDCMVLDVRMPGMSGRSFSPGFRESNSALLVIFVTGYADDELRARLSAFGEANWFGKTGYEKIKGKAPLP